MQEQRYTRSTIAPSGSHFLHSHNYKYASHTPTQHTPSLSEMMTTAEDELKDTAGSEVLMLIKNTSSFSSSASSVIETFIHCWDTLDEKRNDVGMAEKSAGAIWERT